MNSLNWVIYFFVFSVGDLFLSLVLEGGGGIWNFRGALPPPLPSSRCHGGIIGKEIYLFCSFNKNFTIFIKIIKNQINFSEQKQKQKKKPKRFQVWRRNFSPFFISGFSAPFFVSFFFPFKAQEPRVAVFYSSTKP